MKNALCIPEKTLKQHGVVLGKTGAGKSSALRHIVEHLLERKKRVCVLDPKGDWWGLKYSGPKAAGFPVIAFGDFKDARAQDVPISAHSGAHVAELITSGNRPCIIGFRGGTTSAMLQFYIDFAKGIFNANSGELYLVGDEFHNFAPKNWKMSDSEDRAGIALHWSNRLMSEGRGIGIVALIASQRPQKVHNDALTSCETLIAMRVIHAADRAAVQEWIKGCGDTAQGTEVLNGLASLPRGSAYVWSPEENYGPVRVAFPMFETFDSFAPPQLQKAVKASGWAAVDIAEVKEKMATVIEEAKAKDPRELRKRIDDLQRENAKLQSTAAKPAPAPIDPAVIAELKGQAAAFEAHFNELRRQIDNLGAHAAFVKQTAESLERAARPAQAQNNLHRPQSAPAALPVSLGARHNATARPPAAGDAPKSGLRRIMVALAQRPGLTRRQIGVRAGMSSQSGTFSNYLSKLRTNGWLDTTGDRHQLTPAGVESLGEFTPLPNGAGLLDHWLAELGPTNGATRILKAVAASYPSALTRAQIGEATQMSSESGTFSNYLSKLRVLELIEDVGREIRASSEFFQ